MVLNSVFQIFMNTLTIILMKVFLFLFFLSACSQKYLAKDQNRVVVSYKGPAKGCEFLGQDTIESSHFEKLENQELSDIIIGDLVTCPSAKNANYIHVTNVDDELLKRSPRAISSEENKKEHHRTKVEGHFYNCPVTNN